MENKVLIVGLGNPGKKYLYTRHNAGFIFLDRFKDEFFYQEVWSEKYKGLFLSSILKVQNISIRCILLKPLTYMNLSGNSVCPCIKKENIPLEHIIVLHDEIELPFGEIRWKEGGGHRGHNGLRDIIQKCGNHFNRIRIGVGRPKEPISVADYLLSNFTKDEMNQFDTIYFNIKNLLLTKIQELLTTKELT
ncbi:MAG: peptidyl-tRNA hydrolase [Leptospiraceae bacterium]|nr:MAG: peptidyl-tRNA hydrolase [Leptospiraceae bacterium]